jgi:hypothetical protein
VKILVDGKPVTNPEAVYKGMVHQRDELNNQMDRLKDERRDITNRLNGEEQLSAADKAGLEKRLTTIDGRIDVLDKQLAGADAQVASAAAVPGAIVERPPEVRHGPPEEAFVLGGIFLFVAIFPISIAFARRIWRRSAAAVASLPQEIIDRFTQIDQAVESIGRSSASARGSGSSRACSRSKGVPHSPSRRRVASRSGLIRTAESSAPAGADSSTTCARSE